MITTPYTLSDTIGTKLWWWFLCFASLAGNKFTFFFLRVEVFKISYTQCSLGCGKPEVFTDKMRAV